LIGPFARKVDRGQVILFAALLLVSLGLLLTARPDQRLPLYIYTAMNLGLLVITVIRIRRTSYDDDSDRT